jgi:hypothetical protein
MADRQVALVPGQLVRHWFFRGRRSSPRVNTASAYTTGTGSGVLKVARNVRPASRIGKAVRKAFAGDQRSTRRSAGRADGQEEE